jgi:hypothetical protein
MELGEPVSPTKGLNCKVVGKTARRQDRMLKTFVLEYRKGTVEDLTVMFSNAAAQISSRTVLISLSEFGFKSCHPFEKAKLTPGMRKKSLAWAHK